MQTLTCYESSSSCNKLNNEHRKKQGAKVITMIGQKKKGERIQVPHFRNDLGNVSNFDDFSKQNFAKIRNLPKMFKKCTLRIGSDTWKSEM